MSLNTENPGLTKDEQNLFARVAVTAIQLLLSRGIDEPTKDQVREVIPEAIEKVKAFDAEMAYNLTPRAKMARIAVCQAVWCNLTERQAQSDLIKRCETVESRPDWH